MSVSGRVSVSGWVSVSGCVSVSGRVSVRACSVQLQSNISQFLTFSCPCLKQVDLV